MPLNPGVVVAHDVLVVEARQQRDLALDPPELLTGRIHLDPLDRVITAVQLILDLRRKTPRDEGNHFKNTGSGQRGQIEGQYLNDGAERALPQQLQLRELVVVARELLLHLRTEGGAEEVAARHDRGGEIHARV